MVNSALHNNLKQNVLYLIFKTPGKQKSVAISLKYKECKMFVWRLLHQIIGSFLRFKAETEIFLIFFFDRSEKKAFSITHSPVYDNKHRFFSAEIVTLMVFFLNHRGLFPKFFLQTF